jgi:alpha-glucosidase
LALPLCLLLSHASGQKELDWWEKSIFYQIYPRSFKDSDGDGIGDIKGTLDIMTLKYVDISYSFLLHWLIFMYVAGVTSSLEHLKELGVEATWLSPIFKSPMYDFGYDIADFYSIQEEYGTIEDFEELMAKAKELGKCLLQNFHKVELKFSKHYLLKLFSSLQTSKSYLISCQIIPVTRVCGSKKL